jgi:Icc-related predicted phosphoesterase
LHSSGTSFRDYWLARSSSDDPLRIAAAGDIHVGTGSWRDVLTSFARLPETADVLLLAGDLTETGHPVEAELLADAMSGVRIPKVAVLGNHDYHQDRQAEIATALEQSGVAVLEGDVSELTVRDTRVGIAGVKGFGGGFPRAMLFEFGEPEMKAFVRHTRASAATLESALGRLDSDVRIALLHYSPVEQTLVPDSIGMYPFLGSYFFGEVVDRCGVDLVVHGHAHDGSEKGKTPGGIPVRNAAMQVTGRPYVVYCIPGVE